MTGTVGFFLCGGDTAIVIGFLNNLEGPANLHHGLAFAQGYFTFVERGHDLSNGMTVAGHEVLLLARPSQTGRILLRGGSAVKIFYRAVSSSNCNG